MAWRRPGEKPLYEPLMVNFLTYLRVTRPRWVKDKCRWPGCLSSLPLTARHIDWVKWHQLRLPSEYRVTPKDAHPVHLFHIRGIIEMQIYFQICLPTPHHRNKARKVSVNDMSKIMFIQLLVCLQGNSRHVELYSWLICKIGFIKASGRGSTTSIYI